MAEWLSFNKIVHYFGNLGTFGFQFFYGDLVWVKKLVTITFSRAYFLKLALQAVYWNELFKLKIEHSEKDKLEGSLLSLMLSKTYFGSDPCNSKE